MKWLDGQTQVGVDDNQPSSIPQGGIKIIEGREPRPPALCLSHAKGKERCMRFLNPRYSSLPRDPVGRLDLVRKATSERPEGGGHGRDGRCLWNGGD